MNDYVILILLCITSFSLCAAASSDVSIPAESGKLNITLPTSGADSCIRSNLYRVTKLADDGSKGTLRHALHVDLRNPRASKKKSCRKIIFFVQGDIILKSPMYIRSDYITVDGCSAPGKGITITQALHQPFGLVVDGTHRHTHDVILQCLRFKGVHDRLSRHKAGEAMLSIDGDCTSTKSACAPRWQAAESTGGVSRLALNRIVYAEGTDKLTVWGKVKDTSITRSLFYHNPLALLVSFYGGPTDLEKRNILIRGNIFAENNERNPQLRGWIDGIDIRHNILAHWDAYPPLASQDAHFGDGYGIRIKNISGERAVNANIIENVFLSGSRSRSRALIYGIKPGLDPDDGSTAGCLQQGQLFSGSQMGSLFVNGNFFPNENCDHYSTIDKALTLPFSSHSLSHRALCEYLPDEVGVPTRNAPEREILNRVGAQCTELLNNQ